MVENCGKGTGYAWIEKKSYLPVILDSIMGWNYSNASLQRKKEKKGSLPMYSIQQSPILVATHLLQSNSLTHPLRPKNLITPIPQTPH